MQTGPFDLDSVKPGTRGAESPIRLAGKKRVYIEKIK